MRELPEELAKVDAILDDDRFLAPFRSRLTAAVGRPTIPIETYLGLMYLRQRYRLGYETLCKEVGTRLRGGVSAGSRSMVAYLIPRR